ncbi:MAG: tail fiber protein [Actinomycetota bacterium]|nr:tail fiber protein [Actinomycetota bacterium]
MSEPFLGEIRMFPFGFAPRGWALCDGQTMYVAQHSALFSLLYNTYGGDGVRTFALPDLRGRAPVHTGIDELGARWYLGAMGGTERVTLDGWEVPRHTHEVVAAEEPATTGRPGPDRVLARSDGGEAYVTRAADLTAMAREALGPAGDSLPHDNMQPYLTMSFAIALQGVYPRRP